MTDWTQKICNYVEAMQGCEIEGMNVPEMIKAAKLQIVEAVGALSFYAQPYELEMAEREMRKAFNLLNAIEKAFNETQG